ncbi:MAG: ABC transporter substrate-binding protein [Haloarculaceae archaeon]
MPTEGKESASDRRMFLKATGASVAALGLAGCASNGGNQNTGGGGGGGGGESTSGGGGGGGSKEPITIGHIGPVQTDVGKGSERSAKLAVDEINGDGGIMDRQVKLVTGDTQLSPSQTNTVVAGMIDNGVDMIVGGFASETVLGIEDRLAHADVPFLGTGAASPEVTQDHVGKNYDRYKNIFRVGPQNSDFQADKLADYGAYLADKYGWNTQSVVSEDAEWTKPVTARTATRMKEKYGLDVPINKRIAPDTSDFSPVLDDVEQSGARVMMKAIAHIPGTSMLATWGENEYPFAQEGTNVASMSPAYWKDTNGNCRYESEAESAAGGFGTITDKTIPFRKRFQKQYSSRPTTPMYMGCDTYDAIYIYKNAVESAGTSDYANNLDDIVAALEKTDYTGVTGRVQFFGKDEKYPHDVIPGVDKVPYTPVQWQKAEDGNGLAGTEGTKECVWPEKHATADHVPAPWVPTN